MVANLQFCSYASDQQRGGVPCHIDEYMSAVNFKIGLTLQSPRPLTSRGKFSAGKALTTASAAKAEMTAKREKRIVIKLRVGKLGVNSSAWWPETVNRTHLYRSVKWSMHSID